MSERALKEYGQLDELQRKQVAFLFRDDPTGEYFYEMFKDAVVGRRPKRQPEPLEGRTMKWCRHIAVGGFTKPGLAGDHISATGWVMYHPNQGDSHIVVPRSWRVCPICSAERPTRQNIRAAKHRALMDMGDDE